MAAATGRAHAVGSGLNAHPLLDAVQQLIDDAQRPLVIDVPRPLAEHERRLLRTLGVGWREPGTGATQQQAALRQIPHLRVQPDATARAVRARKIGKDEIVVRGSEEKLFVLERSGLLRRFGAAHA